MQSNANITADKVHTIYAWVTCSGYGYAIQSRYLSTHLSCSLYMLAHLSGLSLLWSKEGTEIITAVKVATRATCAPNAIFCKVPIVLLPCRFHAYFKRHVRFTRMIHIWCQVTCHIEKPFLWPKSLAKNILPESWMLVRGAELPQPGGHL